MGCAGSKTGKAEGDSDRYHQEILHAAQSGDIKRLKDTFDELDRRKAYATKKEVLNMVLNPLMCSIPPVIGIGLVFFLLIPFCIYMEELTSTSPLLPSVEQETTANNYLNVRTTRKNLLQMVFNLRVKHSKIKTTKKINKYSSATSIRQNNISQNYSYHRRIKQLKTKWTKYVINSTTNKILPEYPRPQMKRQQWINLNGLWSFTMTYRSSIIQQRTINYKLIFNETIRVPFPVESYLSGIRRMVLSNHYLWYQRRLQISQNWLGKFNRLLLHFDSVDYETYVWINRIFVGKHRGGYQSFSFDITEYLQTSIKDKFNYYQQELIVRVWDPTNEGYQTRGKQLLNSPKKSIYYTPVSGIWQTVWLESVPLVYISKLWFQTTIDHQNISTLHYRVDINIKNRKSEKVVQYISPSSIVYLNYNEFDNISWDLTDLLDIERRTSTKNDPSVFHSSVKLLKNTRYVLKLILKYENDVIVEKTDIVP
ncbi:unnamed protein product, partial [Didymodactylos carnosus]